VTVAAWLAGLLVTLAVSAYLGAWIDGITPPRS
jgi:hypothetical protein